MACNLSPPTQGACLILAIDVHYTDHGSACAGVAFHAWDDALPAASYVSVLPTVAPYTPGQFYQRELPCILHLLGEHDLQPALIVIDGYVFLDGDAKPGLGKHLYDALDGKAGVIGVAKTAYAGIGAQHQVLRGDSIKPLYVTSVGMDTALARAQILAMHGQHRLPTLLKRVDQLCRERGAALGAPLQD